MTVLEYHHAGNSEAQQKAALAYLLAQSSTGKAATGVLSGLAVSQETTASGKVSVAAGAGVAQSSVIDGASVLVNDTATALDVLGANPMGGLARNDLIVLDAATRSLRVIVGTPNAVPTDPATPATAVPLARIRNAASATTVPTSAIDDLRSYTSLFNSGVWVSLPLAGGVSGTLKYRFRGATVDVACDVTGSFASSTFSNISAANALPAAARPTITPARGDAYVGSGATLGSVQVSTAGTVSVNYSAAFSVAQFNFSYPAG